MKPARHATSIIAACTFVFLYLPLAAVVIVSFNNTRHGITWHGFSTRWYRELFNDPRMFELTRNTLVLALVSTVISTVLGTAMAIGISRHRWGRGMRVLIEGALQIPVVMPDILFAVGLVLAFGVLRAISPLFNPGMLTMVLAHVSFQIAFVALVVRGRLATIGLSYDEAARDLYADGWTLFRRVTLPLLAPGIVAGAMLAFTLSLDDFVISFFTYGPESTTLPIFIYASVRRGISPQIHALSTLMLVVTVLLVIGTEALTRRKKGFAS